MFLLCCVVIWLAQILEYDHNGTRYESRTRDAGMKILSLSHLTNRAYNSCYLCTMGNYSTSPLIYIPNLDFHRFRSIYLRDTLGLDLVELIQIRLMCR